MDIPETNESNESTTPSLLDRAKSLGAVALGRATAVADAGKQIVSDRRDGQRRDELLQELGALHLAVAKGGELDLIEAERLIGELNDLEADSTADTDD